MKRSKRLFLLMAACVTGFLALICVSVAIAAVGPPAEGGGEVSEYQQEAGISRESAEQALDLQHRVPAIATEMMNVEGRDFAGLWFDPDTGEFVIPHLQRFPTSTVEGAAEAAGLAQSDFRTPVVPSSWESLERAQKGLAAALTSPNLKNAALTYLDPKTNAIVVGLAAGASANQEQEIRQQLASVIGPRTELERWPGAELKVADTYCRPEEYFRICNRPLRGGQAIGLNVKNEFNSFDCTAGFKGIGNQFGNRFLLTAGHCVDSVGEEVGSWDPVSGEAKEIGLVEEMQTQPGDWTKVKANGSWWDTEHWPVWVARWGNDEEWEIEAETASYQGEVVCHSGVASSGCGQILHENVSAPNKGREHLAMFGPTCANPGDSGGPVFDDHVAIGIMSARIEPAGECGQQYGLFVEITEAADSMGVHVAPRLGAPPFAETSQSACCTGPHRAMLQGEVGPHALLTQFVFEYGLNETYNQTSEPWDAGSAWGRHPVNGEVGGLKGNSTYAYRVRAQNAAGITYGYNLEFTTPDWHPLVQVEGASNRTTSSGTINGSVNPQGESTQYRFEWGPTSAYGSSVPVPDGQVGSGTQFVPVSAPISGLKPERTYHYRLVATNGEGTTVSGDKTFTTLALPPTYDFSFGALGSGAGQFNGPVGQMVDGSGNVWVADSANNRIEKFGRKGEFLFQFGTKGSSAGQMLEPTGVALSPNGTLWIADSGNGRIEQFTQQGAYLQQMGAGPEGMFGKDFLGKPVGIAVDPQGDIWVSDSRDQNVDHFQEKEGIEGHYRGSFNGPGGLPGENEFAGVAGVATDQEGDVFVVDSVNNWLCESKEEVILGVPIRKTYLRAGAAGSGVGQLNAPYGVAVKPSGNVLVAEKGNNRVQQFSPEGEWLASFGSVGAGAGQLSGPRGIAAGRGGTIYVSDFGNNRVERWNQPWTPEATTEAATGVKATEATLNATINPAGSSTTYQFEYGPSSPSYGSKAPATPGSAGSGADPVAKSQLLTGLKAETTYHYRIVATSNEGTVYGQDRTFSTIGPPYDFAFGSAGSGNGQFNGPGGVAVDASGNVWVVDRGNNRLEKFNASGQYLSQFGSKGSGNGQFLEPRDVAVTSAGNIWVTDAGNGRLQEFNSSGAFIRQVGVNEGTVLKPVDHLKEPYGLAIGSEGHVWVTDPGNCAVEVFTETSGNEKYFLAQQKASSPVGNPCESTERGAFRSPTGIAADGAGNAWAADGALNRVTQMKLSPPAIELGSWTISAPSMFGTQGSGNGAFQEPAGVALVGSKLSVADKGNNRVQQFSTAGEYQRQFGSLGSGAGQFSAPRGVAATPGGAQYITDPGNNRVEKWG